MTYTYTLLIVNESGNPVVDHALTPDQAVAILAQAIADRPQPSIESEPKDHTAAQPRKKGGRKKRAPASNPSPRKVARFQPKPCCGSTGPRHKKGCANGTPYAQSDASKELSDGIRSFHQERTKPDPLALAEYSELREAMHDREFQSAQYALTKRLPPREVNTAVRSSSYEDYLAIR